MRSGSQAPGDRVTAWFPLALLAALAGLTFWLDQAVKLPVADGSSRQRHDPDYFAEGFTALKMNAQGNVEHTLSAEYMVHFPDDDTTELRKPRWMSLGAGRAPVTITAEQAVVSSNGENVYFHDNVRVERKAAAEQRGLLLETNYLHVIPDQDIAKTDRAVRISDANTVVDAVGLELNNETRVLKLLSNVKGVYHDPRAARPAPAR